MAPAETGWVNEVQRGSFCKGARHGCSATLQWWWQVATQEMGGYSESQAAGWPCSLVQLVKPPCTLNTVASSPSHALQTSSQLPARGALPLSEPQ